MKELWIPRWAWLKASPVNSYKSLCRKRDWVLDKIAYLHSESAKWRTMFNIVRSPYSLLRWVGLSPQMAVSLLIGSTAVGGGVVANETVFADRSFSNSDPGHYDAPNDTPTSYDESGPDQNTLKISLGSTSVREIVIEHTSVGTVFTGSTVPSGESTVVLVSGNVVTGGSNTRLEIGHLIFENSRCKKLTVTDSHIHTLRVVGNASDGQSLSPSPGVQRQLAISGGNSQADAMIQSGGTFDRIVVEAPHSGVNGKIQKLRLTNLWTKGGDCVFNKLNVGTFEILRNEVGMGNGFATKEFVIASNVTANNTEITDNVEVTIAEPATQ